MAPHVAPHVEAPPYRLGPSKIEFSLERGCKNEEFHRFEKKNQKWSSEHLVSVQ